MNIYETTITKEIKESKIGSYDLLMESSDFESKLITLAQKFKGQKSHKSFLCSKDNSVNGFDIKFSFKTKDERDAFVLVAKTKFNISIENSFFTV